MNILSQLNPFAIIIILFILAVFFSSLVISITIRSKYRQLGESLQQLKEGRAGHPVLQGILDSYCTAAKGNHHEVNTQAIIERHFNHDFRSLNLGERFVKTSVSLMIILGLLGTFYGLTLSIGNLVELLSAGQHTEMLTSMDSIIGGLIDSVRGMSVAFVTSLFAIACAILLTLFSVFSHIETAREKLFVDVEEYLDNVVALQISKEVDSEYELLNQALKSTLDDFSHNMEKSFAYVVESFQGPLTAATAEIGNASDQLLKSIALFDRSLSNFRENTRDFSEFNHHLRTNIDRMNVGFADLTDTLKETTRRNSDSSV
ncbi:MotA/TolQ/ExbB proton channel family protein [Anoxynatronum buryatiense]|uniref:MotA/TolQ/ExbB proton channel family protein n=1 Tax=Anoxynatronum buryatiense TaxID=489973 RepID=A0AA45WSG3_9CLOT|nr:MotA/TolQ/ExbB proton channel family protein [Anoxynatronum buryatiense]SMP37835.1 MotA/TolQ/ExbB proton channel family protein [Anoxynatronum buryatiense]